jgi:hypothetical protein
MHSIAAVIDRYAQIVLQADDYQEVVDSTTSLPGGKSIREMLDAPLNAGATDYGLWSKGIQCLLPGLARLSADNLPAPPFMAVEALLYRAVPKGVARWYEQ